MGIKDFNALIVDKAPGAFIKVPISDFRGKRIAIDSSFLMIAKYKSAYSKVLQNTDLRVRIKSHPTELVDLVAVRTEFLNSFFSTIFELLSWDILPVMILDGTPPADKNGTLDQRKAKRAQVKETVNDLLDRAQAGEMIDFELLFRKLREWSPINSVDINNLINLLENSGLPTLRAPQEADQLCAMLAIDGLVAAVWSSDTDIPVYGCPLLISKFDGDVMQIEGRETKMLQVFSLTRALSGLQISYESFVDLCIMLQCDYNQRIKKMGVKRCYECISQINTLDALNPEEWDLTPLRYQRCRELFRYHPSIQLLSDLPPLLFDMEMTTSSRNLFRLSEAEGIYGALVNYGQSLRHISWNTNPFPGENSYSYQPPAVAKVSYIPLPKLKAKSSSGNKFARMCGQEGCTTRPSFGYASTDSSWFCKTHSTKTMINLTRQKV